MFPRLLNWLSARLVPSPPSARSGERDPIGPAGEKLAAKHMRKQGCRILGRNLRVPMGEADLLCEAPDRKTIVLVEVKTRRVMSSADPNGSGLYAPPELSITADKRRKLVKILRHLAVANRWTRRPLRIDVVAIEWTDGAEPVLRHHADAVPLDS